MWGMAGASGSKHFGGGLTSGMAGVVEGQQQQLQNHFASVQAAESYAKAARDARTSDLANEETKGKILVQHQQARQFALDNGEPDPYPASGTTPAEINTNAIGAQNAAKAANGGILNPVTITNDPATKDDPTHNINAYTVTVNSLRTNPAGVLSVVNRKRAIDGDAPFATIQDALMEGGKQDPGKNAQWVVGQANDSYSMTHRTLPLDKDPEVNDAKSATLATQIERLKQNKDSAGNLSKETSQDIALLGAQKDSLDTGNKAIRGAKNAADAAAIAATGSAKAAQAGAVKTAESAAAEPFVEKERASQAKLQQGLIQANQDIQREFQNNKDALDKTQSTVIKPWQDKYSDITAAHAAFAQAADNPVAAQAAVFKLIGVAQPMGAHRVMPVEVSAFKYPGGIGQKSVEAFNGFLLGKPWTTEATAAANAFIDGQAAAADQNLRHGVAATNGLYGSKINADTILGTKAAGGSDFFSQHGGKKD
jgi:hypothetical protein